MKTRVPQRPIKTRAQAEVEFRLDVITLYLITVIKYSNLRRKYHG
jgi:hypothetical protein